MPKFAETGPLVLKRVDSLAGRLGLVASATLARQPASPAGCSYAPLGRFPEP